MMIQRRRIAASTEVDGQGASVAPEASDLLFEAEDVAELVAEVTGEAVEVTFAVGEDEFTVQAEGDEEILESVRKPMRNKRTVAASTNRRTNRVPARSGRTIRKVPSSRRNN